MNNGGTIIRLVDVAMIILFGFIIISRLKMTEIELPSTVKPPQTKAEKHIIKVKIFRDQKNNIDRFILFEQKGEEIGDYLSTDDLTPSLLEIYKNDRKKKIQLIVLIEPDRDSIIQHTVDLLDLCKKHKIPKNINYKSIEL